MYSLNMLLLAFLSLTFDAVNAVTIRFYPNDLGVCNSTVSMTCANFPQGTNQCCIPPGNALSALFSGLPLPAAQGIIYRGGGCGTSCNAGSGLNLCLTCNPAGYITGANWINPTAKREAPKSAEPCTPIYPNIMTVNGRHFNIGADSDISEGDMAEFKRLFAMPFGQDVKIPAQLLKYENTTYVEPN